MSRSSVELGCSSRQVPYRARASRKAAAYLVNALLTYGLVFACYVHDKLLFPQFDVFTIAWIFEIMGGLFNTLTYAMQSAVCHSLVGVEPRLCEIMATAVRRPSFDVAFVDKVEVVADVDAVNSRPPSFGQSSSFQVQCSPFPDIGSVFCC